MKLISILVAKFAFLCIVGCVSNAAHAEVNDSTVRKWITTGSLQITCGAASADADLTQSYDPEVILTNWKFLKDCRDGGMSQDLNLAAAEWYLFIRGAASSTGDTFYKQLPNWYETIKVAASAVNLSKLLETSSQPVSPADSKVTAWGNAGVEDGLRDYKKRTSQEPSLKTAAFKTGFEFIKSRFY